MRLHRRLARVIADEGLPGLGRRLLGLAGQRAQPPAVDHQAIRAEYERQRREFLAAVADMGRPELERYLWYHTIELPDGLLTPGRFDWRPLLSSFGFPERMDGLRVLDVGSATGFFAFEFERRGARVVSVELPSIGDWDMPAGEDRELTLAGLMREHGTDSLEELHWLHLDGPFRFCHQQLGSRVERCYSSVYQLDAGKLGGEGFDLVFLSDVLLHLFSPLGALSALAPLCTGRLIISQRIPDVSEAQPLMVYLGGDSRHGDNRTWWYPNRNCFRQLLKRLGFREVDFSGQQWVVTRPDGVATPRTVIHAHK